MTDLITEISRCRLCKSEFGQAATPVEPRPVAWFRPSARILIAGQAPGMRVYQSGRPFTDASGDRLRDWLGMDEAQFYDRDTVAIVPMGFCFPGYDAKGADIPPPRRCAATWRTKVLDSLTQVQLTILVGGLAQNWHLQGKASVADRVANWRRLAPEAFPIPHPSWRTNGWIKARPWFETELIPALRKRVAEVLK